MGWGAAPDLIREGSDFVTRLKSDNVWVVVLEKMRHGLGSALRPAGPPPPPHVGYKHILCHRLGAPRIARNLKSLRK